MAPKALSDLVVGDKVCRLTGLGVGFATSTVEKVTDDQITAFGERWMRHSGRKVGGGIEYHSDYLMIWTPEVEAEFKAMADLEKRWADAERICWVVGELLRRAGGDDAIRLAALLPPELIAKAGE